MKRIFVCLIAISLVPGTVLAATPDSERLVEEAWAAWDLNERGVVEQKFQAAIAADSMNTRAYLGLSMLYDMQHHYDKAWMTFRHIKRTVEDMGPYFFAASFTPKMRSNYDLPAGGIIALMESMRADSDERGILRVIVNQFLGEYYEGKGDLEKAAQNFREMGVIRDWKLTGPFDNLSASGFDRVFPPESSYVADAVYRGKNNIPVQWFDIGEYDSYYWINFRYHFPYTQSVFYANTFVYSLEPQAIQLRIGTSGALKAFLNDELMIAYFDENNNDLDTYIVETTLQKGWNRLLIKCGFSEIANCNFAARITDTNGTPIEGLQISSEPQSYSRQPEAPVMLVENFAEVYFKAQIKSHPDHFENYILLADTYMRNDKAIAAELVLREAISRSPGCALFYNSILEAYTRGEKYDEIMTTMEKLSNLDEDIPTVIEFKVSRYLENEQFDEAEPLIEKAQTLRPDSEWAYGFLLSLYGKKQQVDKIIEINKKAYEKFPVNLAFVNMEAVIALQTQRDVVRAVDVYKRYVQSSYNVNGLASLAQLYLQGSDLSSWKTTYDRLMELEPLTPVYPDQMAATYLAMQDYDNAEAMYRQSLAISPYNSTRWEKLGEVYRSAQKLEEAKAAYRNALKFMPTHYNARRVLRELEGKPSIFSHFENVDPAEILKTAPTAVDYPDDSGIILLQDIKRVVYGGGASEYAKEILIKLFDSQGIDDFHEYWIGYNSNSEELTIEKAVTIKQNGAEIAADGNNNHLVFKSLEPGDSIHIKYRVANYYAGRLSNHFWDSHYFNLPHPQKFTRYALLVPEELQFKHRTQNMPDEPEIRKTEDGLLYTWQLTDEPGIDYEEGMPILDDVGKVLHISSIEDWAFMAEWYQDLSRTKARSSYEIKEQVAQVFDDKQELDDAGKINLVYDFITNNIRYSSVSFRQSGLIPQKARDVLVNRIGDCKDVTTLGIAMLREVGIAAHYVLVNTNDEGNNASVLPSISFNHCIAAVETENGLQYLDFTASGHPVGSLPAMDMGGFSLLVKPGVTVPNYLSRADFMSNNIYRESTVAINPEYNLVAHKSTVCKGYMGATIRYLYKDLSQKEREKAFTEKLSGDYPNVRLTAFELGDLKSLTPEVRYRYSFEVPDYVTEAGPFLLFAVPWADARRTAAAVSYESRKYPIFEWSRTDTTSERITITLPPGYEPVELPSEVMHRSPVGDYTVAYHYADGVLTAQRELIVHRTQVIPEDYADFKKLYNAMVKEDERQLLLRR